ncbi:hypothetical protein BKA62DRAFT_44397 [Auriculariales sp. MPI-PUGE-AT-0066]|nr:hypothetical protein BKA62DRAFT_44397 [Auriculariales sp. MPI-PUGE-AT-0066]
MAYNNNPNHFPYYASVEQHQAQQRALYAQQQQATGQQYPPRDMRAHDQDALRRLSAGTPAARMPSSAIRRPSGLSRSGLAEEDDVPGALPAAGYSSYGAFSPVPTGPRSTTVPPGYGGGGALPMSSLTLAPIRGSNVPMSPPTRNAPPNMRQPHLLPPAVSGTQNIPAPSTSGYAQLPYSCMRTECGMRFAHRAELDQHEKAHRNAEKPCPCPYPGCNWRFDFPSDVKYHLKCAPSSPPVIHVYIVSLSNLSKGHTNEKDYICDFPMCGKQYQRKHDLFRHVRDKHPGHQAPGY